MSDARTRKDDSGEKGSQPQSAEAIRVFVADPYAVTRRELASIIEREEDMAVCGQAVTAKQVLQQVTAAAPHVVVLDLALAEEEELALIKELHEHRPHVQIVVFSLRDEQVYAEGALNAGAVGYVMKSEPTERLVEAIRRAMRREVSLSRTATALLLGNLARDDSKRPLHFAIDELTEREMEVFRLAGSGKTVADIASKLDLQRSMVSTHLRRAQRKLGLDSRDELRRFAVQWVMASRHIK